MNDVLISHAINNVWCTPNQDKQMMIKPVRLSPVRGSIRRQTVMWDQVYLPTITDTYHVFNIGHIYPSILNLTPAERGWVKLSTIINDSKLFSQVYFANGVVIPSEYCWINYSRNDTVLLAIQSIGSMPEIATTPVYLRVYTNAYFSSTRSDALLDGTTVETKLVAGNPDTIYMQGRLDALRLETGSVFAYRNGWLVDNFYQVDVVAGDVLELVHDTSIYRVVDFDISSLDSFNSTLDAKLKYLLHYPKDAQNITIDFQDDIECYLLKKEGTGKYKGVYYSRHNADALRMVTHKDYSIPSNYLDSLQNDHVDIWPTLSDLTIRLYIRKSGYERPLVFDNNRIFELYELADVDIIDAMVGIDASVPEWTADALESCAYTRLMGKTANLIDIESVIDAYGYNAISKIVGETPQITQDAVTYRTVVLPAAYYNEATIYEYDSEGLLLGFYAHSGGAIYDCVNTNAIYIEAIAGIAGNTLEASYALGTAGPITIDPTYDFRVYRSTFNSAATGIDRFLRDWVDFTANPAIVVGANDVSFPTLTDVDYIGVINNKRFLGYTLNLDPVDSVLKFTVMNDETHDSSTVNLPSALPPRRLDVWLNGYHLINGLDYHVVWPQVVIVNKNHLVQGAQQRIDVRATGFCDSAMAMEPTREHGFVQHGYLSHNRRYDIRDDKVLSIVLGGKLKMRDVLDFAEDNNGVAVTSAVNGTPYCIHENIVPVRNVPIDTYTLRNLAMEIDGRIADYMTLKYAEVALPDPSSIVELYAVVSPFLSSIIDDVISGTIDNTPLGQYYSNQDIMAWVDANLYLLDFDPAHLGYQTGFVIVHPHASPTPIEVTLQQYQFIDRVNELYFGTTINLSGFFTIAALVA